MVGIRWMFIAIVINTIRMSRGDFLDGGGYLYALQYHENQKP